MKTSQKIYLMDGPAALKVKTLSTDQEDRVVPFLPITQGQLGPGSWVLRNLVHPRAQRHRTCQHSQPRLPSAEGLAQPGRLWKLLAPSQDGHYQ